MARFEEYSGKYANIRMERKDGILQLTFHTEGDSLKWGLVPNRDFGKPSLTWEAILKTGL